MIAEFCQLMSCQNSAKGKIPRDHAAPGLRARRAGFAKW
jgi:hypothetical protein